MKKMSKTLAVVLALVLCVGLFAGCGGTTASTSTTTTTQTGTQTAESGEITIAFIGNTTGDYAQYGIPVRNAVVMYVEQLNANGGINGKTVKLLEYDDKGDGIESVNAYNLAKDQGITAIVGSVLTGATIALADATVEDNMPQITASATAAGVTQIDPENPDSGIRANVFRACFIDPFQGEKMADYAANKLGAKTAAILFESGSDYSEGLKDSFVAKAAELDLEVVATEAFATGDKDFNAQMTKIAGLNPDVVFLPIYYGEAGLAITQGRQAGLTSTFLGGDGFGGIKDYATAEDLEGTVYCSGYAPGTDSVAQFEADYEAKYGEPVPNMFAPLAYDAAMLLCKALKAADDAGLAAGSDEFKAAVIADLKGNDGTVGITGSYSFDEFNNPIKSAAMIVVKDGAEVFSELY
ncbi:MAG: ABC transporter substrate-binding protein [Oscillospiraceae bacterium]|nr:ABC transporter substrate-binding protein [Oscillospiraceae bacterium]